MTEFKTSAFDAIENFFQDGNNDQDPNSSVASGSERGVTQKKSSGFQTSVSSYGSRPIVGRGRSGVGHSKTASSSSSSNLKANEELRKSLLKVGRKKRSRHGNDDDDDDNDIDTEPSKYGDHIDGNDDHDDEPGRTSIAVENKVEKKHNVDPNLQSSATVKKLGKKERMKLKQQQQQQGAEGTTNVSSTVSSVDAESNSNSNSNIGVGHDSVSDKRDETTTKPKRKRRKVRSKQKNIYKDHRSMKDKPSHLVPGSRNYQGRPITEATRQKLGLEKSTSTRSKHGSFSNSHHHHDPISTMKDDDLFVVDRDGQQQDDTGLKLAVDELDSSDDDDDNNNNEEEEDNGEVVGDLVDETRGSDNNISTVNSKPSNWKLSKKPKKRRYKNLM